VARLKFLLVFLIVAFSFSLTYAQSIIGKVYDNVSQQNAIGVVVVLKGHDLNTTTNVSGVFRFNDLEEGRYVIQVRNSHGKITEAKVNYKGETVDVGTLLISHEITDDEEIDNFGIVSLSDIELELDDESFEVSNVLSASRDPFLSTAAFAWGAARFNTRGLLTDQSAIYLNGIKMNELENGRIIFGQWGGLNDVFRNVHNNYGLTSSEYGIGGMLGNSNIDLRASAQRSGTRISYARSNRSYNNRIMLTHSTGMGDKGWALSATVSKRWAQEGFYVPGTFYDAYGYFLGVEKKINSQHSFHLTAFGAPNKRGKGAATLQEVADIVDDKYYNHYWGWQNGEKRNSRVGQAFQPTFIFGHDWKLSDKTSIQTAASYQFGRNGGTALNWYGARNPAGDYHQKLPSRIENEERRMELLALYEANPDFFQVQWDEMYAANQTGIETINNINGEEGTSITGKRAKFIVEDRRYDSKEFNFNTKLTHQLNDNHLINGGLSLRTHNGHNFTEIADLLGADFYLDIDRFADAFGRPGTDQRDLNNTNAIKYEGEIFGYDYNIHVLHPSLWLQNEFKFNRLSLQLGGEINNTQMHRTGNMRNGYFPENSLGDSEVKKFNNYKVKAGGLYQLNRSRVWAHGYLGTRAPFARNAFMSPRSNNEFVPLLEEIKEKGLEAGIGFKSPSLDLRFAGYYADIDNDAEITFFFSEDFTSGPIAESALLEGGFGSFVNHNIDKRHVGLEAVAVVDLLGGWELKGVAAVGQHLYDSRWNMHAFSDNDEYFRENVTVYSDGFFVETSPQKALNFELKYNSTNFWFATVNVSYFGNRYLDFTPEKRLEVATGHLDEGSEALADFVAQERVRAATTLDLFFYKSWKLKNDHNIILTTSVGNVLGTSFISGGYEQLRYSFDRTDDPDYFAPKYYQAYGINFFVGLTYKF